MNSRFRIVTRMAADQRTRMRQERLANFCVMFARVYRKLDKSLDAEAQRKPYVGIATGDACELRDLMGDAVRLLGELREEMADCDGGTQLPDHLHFVRDRELRDLVEQLDETATHLVDYHKKWFFGEALPEIRRTNNYDGGVLAQIDLEAIANTILKAAAYLDNLRLQRAATE